jgi:hypothetical protein
MTAINSPSQLAVWSVTPIVPSSAWLTNSLQISSQTDRMTLASRLSQNEPGSGTPPAEVIVGFYLAVALSAAVGAGLFVYLVHSLILQSRALLRLAEYALQFRQDQTTAVHPPPLQVPTPRTAAEPAAEEQPALASPLSRQSPPGQRRREFKLVIARRLLPIIHDYITACLQQYGAEQEAGGMLVGEYVVEGNTATFLVRGFIEAGPKAEFSAGSILFDGEFQADTLRAQQLEHPTVINVGSLHRHPGTLDVCSGGDAVTDREAVEDSDTKALVFAIITLNNRRQGPSSLFFQGFKFDFYLMAAETGFQYVPLVPTLADLPVNESSSGLRALVSVRGPGVVYDLAVLRQLPGIGETSLRVLDGQAGSGVLLTTSLAHSAETLHVWAPPEGGLRLFRNGENGIQGELAGPWTQADVGRHVWFSHLLLQGLAAVQTPTTNHGRHYASLLENKHRLVAEVRAMRERYGNRAVLRRRSDTLYWEYTVRESGREFPIEIRFPDSYPANPPEIISVQRLPASPHQLGSNQLCWIDAYSGHSEWNPSRDTAVIAVNAAHRWFACLLIYLTTGSWPDGAND